MIVRPSRHSVLLVAGVTAVATVTGTATAQIADAELIRMCDRCFAIEARWQELLAPADKQSGQSDDAGNAAWLAAEAYMDGGPADERAALLGIIAATPARTLVGLRAKASVFSQWYGADRDNGNLLDGTLWSLIDDLMATSTSDIGRAA